VKVSISFVEVTHAIINTTIEVAKKIVVVEYEVVDEASVFGFQISNLTAKLLKMRSAVQPLLDIFEESIQVNIAITVCKSKDFAEIPIQVGSISFGSISLVFVFSL